MKFYIERYDKTTDEFEGYRITKLTPNDVITIYNEHPVGDFDITQKTLELLGFGGGFFNYDKYDYQLCAVREYENETYEYQGEVLYPPPMFLPDCFNSSPTKAK